MAGPLRVEVAGETNVGRKRNHNEDSLAIFSEFGLYVVADGMGGHASGEVASKMAIDTLREFFSNTADDPERTWPYKMDRSKGYEENRLITAIKWANLRIFEAAQRDPKQRGMGTTSSRFSRWSMAFTWRTSETAACTAFAMASWSS